MQILIDVHCSVTVDQMVVVGNQVNMSLNLGCNGSREVRPMRQEVMHEV